MQHIDAVRTILSEVLSLGERKNSLTAQSALLGSLPELDSMAVVNVIAALEEHFGMTVHDDDICSATFATLGSLALFVDQKLAE